MELTKLQDAAPPVPADAVRAIVAEELEHPPEEVFASFDPEPLAAASIGQAHAGILHDGSEVVVKVRRPGVVEQVEQDLEIVRNLAARAARHWELAREYDVVGLAEEFAQTLQGELDYLSEGRNADRFATNFAGDPDVHIPRLDWELTTSRLITLERIRGLKVSDLAALDAAGVDRHALAKRATAVTAKMIFDDGFFHGDPHPGNLFVEEGGRIGLIDFGMVGTVDEQLRESLGDVVVAFTRHDADRLTDAVLDVVVARGGVDRAALRNDVAALLHRYGDMTLGDISIARVVDDVLAVMRQHRLRLPRDLSLLLRVLVMAEGIGADLDPSFRLQEALAPYAERLMERRLAPEEVSRRLTEAAGATAQLGVEAPDQVRRLLRAAEAGDLGVRLRADDLEPLLARAERVGNRIVAAILLSSVLQTAAMIATRRRRRKPGLSRPRR